MMGGSPHQIRSQSRSCARPQHRGRYLRRGSEEWGKEGGRGQTGRSEPGVASQELVASVLCPGLFMLWMTRLSRGELAFQGESVL